MLPTSVVDNVISPPGSSPSPAGRPAQQGRSRRSFSDRLVELSPHSDGAPSRATAAGDRPGASLRLVLDLLVEGTLLVDAAGEMFYRNPALERLLLDDDDRGTLIREMRQFALSLRRPVAAGPAAIYRREDSALGDGGDPALAAAAAAAGFALRDTRTVCARYRMRGATLDDTFPGAEHAVIVTLERLTLALPSALVLADRFRLTACEAGVTLLLAQGHSNGAIAKMLGISPHTARHHTESVLLKLNVHSRAEVGGKVLGTRRPSGPRPAV